MVPGARGCGVRPLRRAGLSWWPLALTVAGGWRARARAGADARAWGRRRVPVTEGLGAAWWGGASSGAGGGAACPGGRGGRRRWQAVAVGDAVRGVSQQRPGHAGRAYAAGRSCRAGGRSSVWSPGTVAVSAAVSHAPPGGARVGGGGESAGRPGSRVGPQHPNKGMQATAASVRSCLAPAARRA